MVVAGGGGGGGATITGASSGGGGGAGGLLMGYFSDVGLALVDGVTYTVKIANICEASETLPNTLR